MTEGGRNAPDDLASIREAHKAVLILRTLDRETSGALNDSLLAWALDRYALDDGRDSLRALLDRLERQGLVIRIESAPEVVIVRLTERGSRVAMGRDRAEGVMRVFPDCPY